jgi:hypothetical protein
LLQCATETKHAPRRVHNKFKLIKIVPTALLLPHINVELLLIFRMNDIMRIIFCPVMLVVNIDDASKTPTSLNGCGDP